MIFSEVRAFCETFYMRFSVLDLCPFQLRFFNDSDSVSIALISKNETGDIKSAVSINEDSIRVIKINSFEKLDVFFTFATPLELFNNLLTLLLVCCGASNVFINPSEAISATLGRKIKTWRELVIYICSLLPEEQGKIIVQENRQNALRLLKTSFQVTDGMFVTDGLYKSQTSYKDLLELIRAVLDALSAVLKIHDYEINPFSNL